MTQQLLSAEGATRYLRSKDISIDEIVKVSNDLLDGKVDVYLPNKKTFVLELVCDRLNDNKQLKYKTSSSFWELLNKVYALLDDTKQKNRILQSFKFGEAVQAALEKSDTENQTQILPTIIETINLFRLNSSLSNYSDYAVAILSSILRILNNSDWDKDKRLHIIEKGISFFRASVSTEKYNKKFVSHFISTALPLILVAVEKNPEDQNLVPLVKKVLFSKEQLEVLIDNTKALLSTDISRFSIVFFYKLVIDTVAKSEIEIFEQLFILITAKFPNTSETLLEYISSTKRTLSHEFLKKVFDQEFSKSHQDLNMIRSILELDIEIGLEHAEKILIKIEEKDYEAYIAIVEAIINSFIRARDLRAFFKLWEQLLQSQPAKYESPEFSNVVSKYVNTLSFTQLKTIVEDSLKGNGDSKFTILSAIVEGFLTLKNKVILDQSEDIFREVFRSTDESPQLWKLKYQLLTLYESIVSEEDLLNIASSKYNNLSEFQYYTLFRIREIIGFDIDKIATSFVDFICNGQSQALKYAFSRWFVLVNQLFTTDQIKTLTSELLKDNELLLEILTNQDLLEQLKIIESIIDHVTASMTTKNVDHVYIQALQLIPIQCYTKRVKPTLIDNLCKTVKKAGSSEVVKTIAHILQTPTFRSAIETDISEVIPIVKCLPESKVFDIIWQHHLKNIKESTSEKYVNDVIKSVTKSLKDFKFDTMIPEFYLASTILSNRPASFIEEISELKNTFIRASKSLLKSYLLSSEDTHATSWLLQVLHDLDLLAEDFTTLQESLKLFGFKIQDTNDTDSKAKLYALLTKYWKFTNNTAEYYEALYLVLRQSGVPQETLLQGLENVFKGLEDDQFNSEYIKTLKSVDGPDINYIAEIIAINWKVTQRLNHLAIKLFVNSLSKISKNLKKFTDGESVILLLTEIKSLLTDKSWVITQYGLEAIIGLLTQLADFLVSSPLSYKEQIFQQITLVTSNILLFHRFRLSNRHHIVLSLFNSLLKALANRTFENPLASSKASAEALSRLLSNLCEPQVRDSKARDSLTSTSATLKRSLRKYIPVTLLTYIHLSLKYSFQSEIREVLLPGVFNIFDVLSQQELILVSTSLDSPGRTYYRTLYDEYKKVGKWQID